MRAASYVLALTAGLIGLLVLAGGWILDISALRSIIPDAASMKVNTALCIMLAAGTVLLAGRRQALVRRLALSGAILQILIALITLVEYATGRDLRIDQFLIPDRTSPVLVTAPGRMSFVTAISFLFLGSAFVLRRRRFWDQYLTVATAVLCLANLIGYIYGIDNFAGIAFYTGMAVHTSSALLMLAIAVLLSEPQRGLTALLSSEHLGGFLTRRLLPAAVLVPVALGWLRWQGELHGFYGTAFGLALFATANVVVFASLIWTAGRRLNSLDLEKARAAALVEAREELLRTFVKHVPAAVAMIDRDMRYLHLSDRWLADTVIFPDSSPPWKELCHRGLEGRPLKSEGDWVGLDGKSHTIRQEVRPWGDTGADTGGVIVFFEDITERKHEELELRKFVSLADNSAELIGMCDMNLMPFYANQAALRLLGLDSLEQVLRTPVPEFFFPEDRQFIVGEFFPRVLREGRAEVEISFRHFRTGQPVWMIYNVFYIQDADGRSVGLATVSRDITERKQAEETRRQKDATIRTLLETAAQGILAVDTGGAIVLANRMAAEMFGYEPGELLGRRIEDLLPQRLRSRHAAHRAAFFADPRTRPMGTGLDLQGLRRDGTEFPIELSLSGLDTASGPLAVSFISDITERKRAETALRVSEQQLRELTGSLITAQEDERRRLSRELHDDITQQLAVLSMDLGSLQLQTTYPNEETHRRLDALRDHTLRMADEVRRISHGLHPSVIEDFGFSTAMEEFCGEFSRAHGISVRFQDFMEDSELCGDTATCLYRVVQESVRNAAEHGHATDICIQLSAEAECIRLRIQDNGAGFVTDAARTRPGLGITSMTERIRLIAGTLTITSAPGHGAEVNVSVPTRMDGIEWPHREVKDETTADTAG